EEEEGSTNKGKTEQNHHHPRINHHVIRDPFKYNVGSLSTIHSSACSSNKFGVFTPSLVSHLASCILAFFH
ncbi:hypothetical protein PIB30_108890, partial [Stylosanthes scabra]|nr:hypothetical protein [Stylosanthes scabra]